MTTPALAQHLAWLSLIRPIVEKLEGRERYEFTATIVRGKVVTNRPAIRAELQEAWNSLKPTADDLKRGRKIQMATKRMGRALGRAVVDIFNEATERAQTATKGSGR